MSYYALSCLEYSPLTIMSIMFIVNVRLVTLMSDEIRSYESNPIPNFHAFESIKYN